MSHSEHEYIELCKRQLEEKFSFGNGQGYSQKDLELLSNYIEEEKGVYISLSTLKRLWKNSFKHGPQLATLNALVNVLDYDNWQHFKLKNKRSKVAFSPRSKSRPKEKLSKNLKTGLILGVLGVLIFTFLIIDKNRVIGGVSINGPILFEADKTISKGVPNTFIFKYDVSKVKADSFFIQQSWNNWRRQQIDPNDTVFSNIYFESGFHRAKLYANNEIIAKIPVHILSDGWEPHVYYKESDERFIDFHGESFVNNGQLHISKELLIKRNVDITKHFESRISNSQQFNIFSDNFSFMTRVKLDKVVDSNCPWLNVLIITEEHIFKVGLVRKGCETYADYKLGEIYKSGVDSDLTLLGQDVFEWQEIGINVKDKKAEITINGESAYTESFKEDFGKIVGLTYIFDGTGSIEYVKLSDVEGNVAFEDDFEN